MGFLTAMVGESAAFAGNANFMDLIEDSGVPALQEDTSFMQAALESVAQSEENYNSIIEACAITELRHYQENGTEYVYTEATGTGFIASAKAFFAKIWEKIKSLFKKFAIMLGSLTKNGKDFVDKYRKDIVAAISNIPSDAEIKGYNYSILGVDKAYTDVGTTLAATLEKVQTLDTSAKIGDPNKDWDFEEEVGKIRAKIVNETGDLNASEYSKALFALFRAGEDSPIDIELNGSAVNTAMGELQQADKVKAAANKAYNNMAKYFGRIETALTKLQTAISKDFPKKDDDTATNASNWMTDIQRAISLNRAYSNAAQVFHGAFLTACRDHVSQCKKICVKVVSYKAAKHEGYSFEHYGEAGFLEGVVANMK